MIAFLRRTGFRLLYPALAIGLSCGPGLGATPSTLEGPIIILPPAPGVRVAPTGVGSLVVYPYFTTRNGAVTNFSVQSASAPYLSIFVRLHEGVKGGETRGWKLYLPANGTRRFRLQDDGTAARIFDDGGDGCLVPTFPTDGIPLTNILYADDGGPSGLDRTREGFATVIVEAELELPVIESIESSGCETVTTARHTGPSGIWFVDPAADTTIASDGVRGAMSIDGLPGRAPIRVPAVPFLFFNPGNQHTNCCQAVPNLNTGNLRAFVTVEGVGSGDTDYASSAESVSAVLMAESRQLSLRGREPAWVVSFPTKQFFTDGVSLPPFSSQYAGGFACEPASLAITTRTFDRDLCFVTNVVNFDAGNPLGSILSPPSISAPPADSGDLDLFGTGLGNVADTLTLNGLPVIAFSISGTAGSARPAPSLVLALPGDRFGQSLGGSGDVVVIGAPGADRVETYRRRGGTLVPESVLPIPDGLAGTGFGATVTVNNDLLAVASMSATPTKGDLSALPLAIYERIQQAWNIKATIDPPGGYGLAADFGSALAIGDGHIVVGAPGLASGGGTPDTGAVLVYDEQNLTMMQLALPTDGGGVPIEGGSFGSAISAKSGGIAVGAPTSLIAAALAGGVSVYDALSLSLMTNAVASDANADDRFGSAVSLESDALMVGAPGAGDAEQGAVYIYELGPMIKGSPLIETVKISAPDGGIDDRFGTAVASLGTQLAVGAPGALGPAGPTGVIYIFETSVDPPVLLDQFAPVDPTVVGFGTSVALLQNLLIGGAPDSNSEAGSTFYRESGDRLFIESFEF